MSAKHTPGPWSIYSITFKGYHQIACAQGGRVCQVVPFKDEYKANARLIAAAPDLLEALKSMCEGFSALKDSDFPALAKARAAIAKAEGKP